MPGPFKYGRAVKIINRQDNGGRISDADVVPECDKTVLLKVLGLFFDRRENPFSDRLKSVCVFEQVCVGGHWTQTRISL